jgi:hypothetical protein
VAKSNKNVDIKFSMQDAFLESPSGNMLPPTPLRFYVCNYHHSCVSHLHVGFIVCNTEILPSCLKITIYQQLLQHVEPTKYAMNGPYMFTYSYILLWIFAGTWWRWFQKGVLHTKFDIYVFIIKVTF